MNAKYVILVSFLFFSIYEFNSSAQTIDLFKAADVANTPGGLFEFGLFENPASIYWPGYFYSWVTPMTTDKIREKMTSYYWKKALSVVPLPQAKDWRPLTNPSSLEPDYMTDAYLELFRYSTEQCHSLNMNMWLYDEGGWPSGTCVHRVVEQNPALVQKKIVRSVLTPVNGEIVPVPVDCISAFLYQGQTKIKQLSPGTTETINIDNARLLIFSISSDGYLLNGITLSNTYPDLLNPLATQEFIRLTHEEYKKTIGEYFGNTIRFTFTDEVQVANPGWTDDLAVDFEERFGYDIRDELPSIFEGDSEHDKKVRIDYFDWWSRRHADAYYGVVQAWCRENNLLSGGHLYGEDATIYANKYTGHPLRMYRKMDVPGVDVISRHIWPQNNNHSFPKYASTVAHQAGTPWSFTESFAVYGRGLSPADMKWITDYQYVRGINLLVMSYLNSSTNPLWRFMDVYHSYIARLGYLLSLGEPGIKTALYYPVRDLWAGGSELEMICSSFDELSSVLLNNQCDYDLIDDDILESNSSSVTNGCLVVGEMHYSIICVSSNKYMSEASRSKLQQFINDGGKVIWVDDMNNYHNITGVINSTLSQLPSHLKPTLELKSPNVNIRACKRELDNGSLYFVTNEGTTETSCILLFNETLPLIQLDPETGKCWVPSKAVRTTDGWELPVDLKFAGSYTYLFSNAILPTIEDTNEPPEVLQTMSSGWSGRKTTVFSYNSSGGISITYPTNQPVNVTLGDWKQVVGTTFSGDVEYTVTFECSNQVKDEAQVLNLGDVRYVSQVWLNNEYLGKRLWPPYCFDVRGKIKTGTNVLKIVVTNTIANQFVYYTEGADNLDPYIYRGLELKYSREAISYGSGLYGPVTLAGTSEITRVEEIKETNEGALKVYPIPTSSFLMLDDIPDLCHYQIYDLYGQLLSLGKVENGRIDVNGLRSGVYILRIYENSRRIFHAKIIVLHD